MSFTIKRRRILVIKNRAIGDTILLTGPLRLLRRNYPKHEIHAMVRSPAGQLLESLPYVDRVISALEPKEKIERIAYWMRLIRRLRDMEYELILNFHASFRTSLTAKFLRAKTVVSNHHELGGRNWFSDLPVPGRGQVKPVIDRDLDVLRAIGISATIQDAMPEIVLSSTEKSDALKMMGASFATERVAGRPCIFLGIGGSRATKRWPPAHFAKLMRMLVDQFDAQFVLATIESDKPWLDQFLPLVQSDRKTVGRIRHFDGVPLRQTAQVMSQCSLYIGNDSGLKHLAIALGLRSYTFFGPEAPMEWHPYDLDRHSYSFLPELQCRTESGNHWCSIPVCDRGHKHKCMQEVPPESAWAEVSRLVRAYAD